jgi:hypothetical protein
MKISDDVLRDAAVCQIVRLCMKANDSKTAAILVNAIQTETMKDEILREHPQLDR